MRQRLSSSQRAYADLRVDLLMGALPVGRLDIQRLADRLRVSTTPVREALARLAAERLVQTDPGHGYSIAQASSDKVRGLYAWNAQLMQLALKGASTPSSRPLPETRAWRGVPISQRNAHAHDVCRFFMNIALHQTNEELGERVAHANDRLFLLRTIEPLALAEANIELAEMEAMWGDALHPNLSNALDRYHLRRVTNAELLVDCLTRETKFVAIATEHSGEA